MKDQHQISSVIGGGQFNNVFWVIDEHGIANSN
jgi:hypothetical protein